jgi:nucleoside-diphosphate-sugar epimerase
MASTTPIKNVLVLGSTGNIGSPIVHALVKHPARYNVTAVTRDTSKASFPPGVKVVASDLSNESLQAIFKGQDAIVSCVPGPATLRQKEMIDIAISLGVRRFLPSEFGMNSAHPEAAKHVPGIGPKVEVTEYLKSKEDQISWTAVIVGSFLDWSLRMRNPVNWNIPDRTVLRYNGGDYDAEFTNLDKIGEAVAAILSPEHESETANQFVNVNSFTTTQNHILSLLEAETGEKFKVTDKTTDEAREEASKILRETPGNIMGVFMQIAAAFYGEPGLNQYSKNTKSGLWNDRLGLREESLEETVRAAVKSFE